MRGEAIGQEVIPGLGRLQGPGEVVAGRGIAWFCRLRVRGAGHIPRSGPAILAATHESMFDVPLVVIAGTRPVTFMAHADLFRSPLWARFFHGLGGFPVRRGEWDTVALRTALTVLERGGVLGVFPEGTRNFGQGTKPFLPGVAWLALRTGAPIVPCAISGTTLRGVRGEQWWKWVRRRDARVAFGPPIRVASAASAAERRRQIPVVTASVRSAVDSLFASMPAGHSNAGGSGTLDA